ncbi:unnamed protein product [Leptidea sinapis]|uniref:Uncharacterized protein n=1 Tax=Leptidea sinapis TaxID=189913 RepID=A0A5E4QW94_9NEOP|nr:unnamed protein product [Leptidea sinapis]
MRSFMRPGKSNLLMMVLKRYLSGPIWIRLTDREIEACYKTWWTNVLIATRHYGVYPVTFI